MQTHIDHLLYRVSLEDDAGAITASAWIAASFPVVLEEEWCELPVPEHDAVRDAVERLAAAAGRADVRAARVATALARATRPAWGRALVGVDAIQLVDSRPAWAALVPFGLVRGRATARPVVARASREGARWALSASVVAIAPGASVARHEGGFALGAVVPRRSVLADERLVIAVEPGGEVSYDVAHDQLLSTVGLRRASHLPFDASVERTPAGPRVLVRLALPDGSLTARVGPFDDPAGVPVSLMGPDEPDALGAMPGLALTPEGLALVPADARAPEGSVELIPAGGESLVARVVTTARLPWGFRNRVAAGTLVAIAAATAAALARGGG